MRRKSPANTLIGACSSDPQMPGADAHQGALCAPALGPINKADDLAILGVSDGFPPGQVGLVVAVLTGAHDEPDQLSLGVERPILGETMVEDHDVVHGALLLLDGCGSLWHSLGEQAEDGRGVVAVRVPRPADTVGSASSASLMRGPLATSAFRFG